MAGTHDQSAIQRRRCHSDAVPLPEKIVTRSLELMDGGDHEIRPVRVEPLIPRARGQDNRSLMPIDCHIGI
jgi:hypothetical protein